ncbi:MAG: lipid-A-disaccharide synthase [Betaproteobacteria bacterium]|nr:lipid-A-disaccharide synthase [Betaproteobacteria bacterium]MDE2211589.1 lipid-A-disaccharide synthase [Betaproteobacteria bacterium]
MRVGVVAGEASGDALGVTLIEAIRMRYPDAVFEGIAGPGMQSLGAHSLYPMEKLSVRGYVEVLKALPVLLRIRRELIRHFLAHPPDLFVGIDAPDFNLTLEKHLKQAGIPTLHMVAPTVWAWRANRMPAIRESVNGILSIFPFEKPIFEQAGISITDIGHPLAQRIPEHIDRQKARQTLGLVPDGPVVALLPGSRISELEYHARLFVATAAQVAQRVPHARFVAPLIDVRTRELFADALRTVPDAPVVQLLEGRAHDVLAAADVALVASGTATLEAALLKCPMVITYKLSALTAWLARRRGVSGFVGLPNIILNQPVVPELIQEQATPQALAENLVQLLNDPVRREAMVQAFERLHRLLHADSHRGILQGVDKALRDAA